MYAGDFVSVPIVRSLTTWNGWHEHIDKHLAHLTKARITNSRSWTGTDNKTILDEFQTTWRDFYSKLTPALRPIFDAEITAMERQFPGVSLR